MLPTDLGECQVPVEHGETHTGADAGLGTSKGVFSSFFFFLISFPRLSFYLSLLSSCYTATRTISNVSGRLANLSHKPGDSFLFQIIPSGTNYESNKGKANKKKK